MKKQYRALGALLAGAMALTMAACEKQAEPEIIPEVPPVKEELILPDASEPGLPEVSVSKEQASLVDSDLMLHRLEDNLLDPVAASIRLDQKDSSMKTQLNAALLEEVAGFLCQNYTVLRFNAQVDLRGAIYMNVIGEKKVHDVYVQQWLNGDGVEQTFVQVEEDGMMGQYVYDATTYGALVEVLEGWQYENNVVLDGPYRKLRSEEQLKRLNSSYYKLEYLLQYGEDLLMGLQSANHTVFESISTRTGRTRYSIDVEKPVLDVRNTAMEGYDYYIVTRDSVHYRSIDDTGLKLDFSIPQTVQEKLLKRSDLPLFDVDYVKDELVYASEEGIVLSNQAGKKEKLVLKNEHLYDLLLLNEEESEKNKENQEELVPVYAAPKLMNNGRMIICPILLQGESDQWVGFSIVNLMNGTSKNSLFGKMDSFCYPDDETIRIYDSKMIYEMDIHTLAVQEQGWDHQVNETPLICDMNEMLLWRQTMDHKGELAAVPLAAPDQERSLLIVEGDRVKVHGKTEDYALISWSDGDGDSMAVVLCSPQTEE